MKWTSARPKTAGYYWMRMARDPKPAIARLADSEGHLSVVFDVVSMTVSHSAWDGIEWSDQPIQPPAASD